MLSMTLLSCDQSRPSLVVHPRYDSMVLAEEFHIVHQLMFVDASLELKPEFFYKLIYEPSYCNFPESRKKIKFNF